MRNILKLKTKAFTLVELIISITILAILATIAFINLGNYPADSRDAVRKSDLRTIEKAMTIYHIENGRYPTPDKDPVDGKTYFGEKAFKELGKINKLPLDPTTGKPYRYISLGVGYILVAELENGELFRVDHSRLAFQTCGMDYNSIMNKYGGIENSIFFTNDYAFTAMKADGTLYSWGNSDNGGGWHPTEKGFIKVFPVPYSFFAITPYGKIKSWRNSYHMDIPDEEGFIKIFSVASSFGFGALKIDNSIFSTITGANKINGTEIGAINKMVTNHRGITILNKEGEIKYFGNRNYWSSGEKTPEGTGWKNIYKNGNEYYAAINEQGALYSWGKKPSRFVPVPQTTGWSKVYSNYYAFLAINDDGCIAYWGDPVWSGTIPLSNLPNICGFNKVIPASSIFYLLNKEGKIFSTANTYGIPSNGGRKNIYVNSGAATAIDNNGCLASWGNTKLGGSGAPTDCGFREVFSSALGFTAIKGDGSLVSWGDKSRWGGSDAPTTSGWKKVFSNWDAFVAIDEKGCLKSWGDSNRGGTNAPTDCGRIEVNGSRVDDLEDCSQM